MITIYFFDGTPEKPLSVSQLYPEEELLAHLTNESEYIDKVFNTLTHIAISKREIDSTREHAALFLVYEVPTGEFIASVATKYPNKKALDPVVNLFKLWNPNSQVNVGIFWRDA